MVYGLYLMGLASPVLIVHWYVGLFVGFKILTIMAFNVENVTNASAIEIPIYLSTQVCLHIALTYLAISCPLWSLG